MGSVRREMILIVTLGSLGVWAGVADAQRFEVTFVGDSVPAAIGYVGAAQQELARGLDVDLDLLVCRRLVTTGCRYRGSSPPSALDTIRSAGAGLGDVLVVDVGYNDSDQTYREGMDEVIRAAKAEGVKRIVWVTLRETRENYHWTNVTIRSEAKRWPIIEVADWNAYSQGRPWFGSDGLHLNAAGAEGLATFLRPLILEAADHPAPASR
jgi:hypothetical protein